MRLNDKQTGPIWTLHVDGSTNVNGSGACLVFVDPKRIKVNYALRFAFKASNKKAEYKALIVGLNLARELGAKNLRTHSDSQLVVNQVNGKY